jgi:putative transposase
MESIAPNFSGLSGPSDLQPVPARDLTPEPLAKDWPHAPVHRLSENGVYLVTAGTLHKQHLFDSSAKRDLLERLLLTQARAQIWDLEAWAVFANHYHFVARGNPNSLPMREFIRTLHSVSARELNALDQAPGRTVWHNFWDTRLTHQYSYLARLNYVHQNAVKHRLVAVASQYPWCSAAWFERVASPAKVKTIYGFKADAVVVPDDY